MKIKFKRLNDKAKLPTRATDGSAGLDLCWDGRVYDTDYLEKSVELDLEPWKLRTGLAVQIPPGYVGIIKERSGLGSKGIQVRGGVIDSDYRGEIVVMLQASGNGTTTINPGDKIAQLVVVPCLTDFEEVEELTPTERGEKGFGSTGR